MTKWAQSSSTDWAMTSKVEQLFLELCLLRLRYSQTELQQVANMREVMDDPDLRTIVAALRYLQWARRLQNEPLLRQRSMAVLAARPLLTFDGR